MGLVERAGHSNRWYMRDVWTWAWWAASLGYRTVYDQRRDRVMPIDRVVLEGYDMDHDGWLTSWFNPDAPMPMMACIEYKTGLVIAKAYTFKEVLFEVETNRAWGHEMEVTI